MLALAAIGFLVFTGSLIYAAWLGIMKLLGKRDKELFTKQYLGVLFGSAVMLLVGANNMEETVLKTTYDELETKYTALEQELDEVKATNKLLQRKNDEAEQTLKDNIAKAKEEAEASLAKEKEVWQAKEKELNDKIVALEQAKQNAVAQAAAPAPQQVASSPTQQKGAPESFKNCTEMRKVYPNGVDSNHPAYESRHDRDKDGWACER